MALQRKYKAMDLSGTFDGGLTTQKSNRAIVVFELKDELGISDQQALGIHNHAVSIITKIEIPFKDILYNFKLKSNGMENSLQTNASFEYSQDKYNLEFYYSTKENYTLYFIASSPDHQIELSHDLKKLDSQSYQWAVKAELNNEMLGLANAIYKSEQQSQSLVVEAESIYYPKV